MNSVAVRCTKCQAPLPGDLFNLPDFTRCPACGVLLRLEIFPALFRQIAPSKPGETLIVETEAGCFYHPDKKAVLPCEGCGRFMCSLCDCELDGRHFCPSCLDVGKKKGKIKSIENRRVVFDSMALWLALAFLIPPITYLSFITAPMAVFIAIRYWNHPTSIVHRSRIRNILAVIFGSLQICGWVALLYFLFFVNKSAH